MTQFLFNLRGAIFLRWQVIILSCLMPVFMTGCSGFKLAYNLADYQLSREARFYLDVSETEEEYLNTQIASMLEWHRSRMLPQYAAFFSAQADLIEKEVFDESRIKEAVQQLRLLLDDTFRGASPFFADVLVHHSSEEKVRYIEARIDERNTERLEENQEPLDDRIKSRAERIVSNFERFMGDLNEIQKFRIDEHARESMADNSAWTQNRAKRQGALLEYLSQRPDQALLADFLYKLTMRSYEIVDPSYRAVTERRWRRFEVLFSDIVLSLSAEQRLTFVENLRSYAADMVDLSS